MTFEAQSAAFPSEDEISTTVPSVDFRTPSDPEPGWAARNPDRALLFLFVAPRDCSVVEELMAL
jgi:hypothetical protein